MKISFVIPFINWTGGIRVVFEYAEGLRRRGHEVTVYFPLVPYAFADRLYTPSGIRRWVGDLVLNGRRGNAQKWFDLRAPLVMVPWVADPFVAPADAIVATAWPTAFSVHRLSVRRGAKFYFVQGYETWSGQERTVDDTYRLPLHKIVIASWLRELLGQKFRQPVLDVINNGVDLLLFHPESQLPKSGKRVLAQYSPLPLKGIADALDAWDIVRSCCPEARLVMFGLERGPEVPPDVEFHLNPSQESLCHLYNSCDVFLSASWAEGCQLPPMEAMACGSAVVATNVGGVPDYAIQGKTALVVPPHEPEAIAEAVIRLLRNDDERRQIAQAGYEHIQQFTWGRAVERFEAALLKGLETS